MQKIYLLLRDNNQLGPFTIEELLEQDILPTDLVWIEGKSLAWSYASELNLLKLSHKGGEGHSRSSSGTAHPATHSTHSAKRKRPRLRKGEMPHAHSGAADTPAPLVPSPMSSAFTAGDVERKAEELRQRALAAERMHHPRQPAPAQNNYTPSLPETEESDIEFIYHKRRHLHIPFPQVLVGGMITAMLVAGWYGKPLFRQKMDTVDATATPLMHTEENTAAAPLLPKPQPMQATIDSSTMQDSLQATTALYTGGVPQRQYTSSTELEATPQTAVAETTSTEPPTMVPEKPKAEEAEKPAPIVVTAKKEPAAKDTVEAVAEEDTKERKRGFLKGLFKKKKNKDTSSAGEASAGQSNEDDSKDQQDQ